jgi:protocatechuate 3,4-dioxygenase beta subunit
VTIHVTNAQTAQPLPGATVTLDPDRLHAARSATTDAQGNATVTPRANAVHKHALRVSMDGMAAVEARDIDKLERPIHIELSPLEKLSGKVVDEQGKPIVGAVVNFFDYNTHPQPQDSPQTIAPEKAVTDQEGRWTAMIPAVAKDVTLAINHPDYIGDQWGGQYSGKPTFEQMRNGSALSTLHKGLVVTGTVYDFTGQPVANARVAQGFEQRAINSPPTTHTDAAGHFRFTNTPPGQLVLTVSASGSGPALIDTTAESGMKPIDVHLTQPHLFRFRVVDKKEQPLAGATVEADTWRQRRTLDWSATTDKEGRAVWKDAPDDPVLFTVYKDGYVNRNDPAMLMSADNGKEHVITLWPSLKIRRHDHRCRDRQTHRAMPAHSRRAVGEKPEGNLLGIL